MTSQNSMNSRLFPFPVFRICLPFLLMIPAISLASPAYAYDDYEWFLNCKDPDSLNCESITPFPLWRFNETVKNCGYPGELMKLNCEGDRATIQMLGAKYKLLGFNFTFSITDQILIIAEIDSSVSDPFCSPKQQHTPSNSILAIIPVYNSDCSQPTCSAPYCPFSILVPISPSLLEELGADDWQNVAHQILAKFNNSARNLLVGQACTNCSVSADYCGYDLELNQTKCYCQSSSNGFEDCPSSPYAEAPTKAQLPKTEPAASVEDRQYVCYRCRESGGQCGSEPSMDEFTCYCLDGGFKTTCGSTPSDNTKKPKKTTPLVIALGVSIGGACLVATILGCCFFYCLRRKKKHPIGSITKEGHSPPVSDPLSNKDISPPPLILNSLYQTHSIPSYPSSKSDLERASTNHDIQVFNYAELEKATDNFNSSRELGDGGFGTVYYGKLVDGRKVAVKRLYEHNCKRVEQFLNEVDILAHLQHKNLVKLYGCTSRFSQGLLLVYEYIPNGTVADHLHGSRANFGLLSWPIRLRIATETANALAYLHRSEIIHRDVKTNNILLDNNFIVKVADFGLSRLFPTDVTHVSTAPQGTPGYVDPEYYQCYQLTTKSDVYSFGVVLIELLSSLRAVDTDRKRHDINLSNMAVSRIQSGALNELIDPKLGFDKNHEVMREITLVAELAFRCLQQERDMRPSMEEVVEVLREIENDQSSSGMAKVVDIGVVGDDTELTKRTPPSFSPNSVIANNWVNSSSTTNSL